MCRLDLALSGEISRKFPLFLICRIAGNIDQAKQFIESGFDYVTNIDEHKLFRKRK